MWRILGAGVLGASLLGCSSGEHAGTSDASVPLDLGDAVPYVDAGISPGVEPRPEGGADAAPDDRFITKLVRATYGPCAGFGQGSLPWIIEGPPVGGGTGAGSLDVLSLGNGGEVVVSFEPNAIVDGPGPDFIVFENPFHIGGSGTGVYAEPGQVSVSDDGVTWTAFPCTATNASGPPYPSCAGWHPVFSSPANGISPFDASVAGGDAFDLHDIGVAHAKYVKIVDQGGEPCSATPPRTINNGFDLDAIAILNAELP